MKRGWLAITVLLLSSAALAEPKIWHEPVTGMPFVALAKGCFGMGTEKPVFPDLEAPELVHLKYKASLSADERPRHEVCVDAFLLGQYEVRARDWIKVMGAPPPQGEGEAPAGGISWEAAQEFARRLTHLSGKHRFRLPTEAEWEYACRAGAKKDAVPFKGSHKAVAWYRGDDADYLQRPGPVGKLKANAWGLHDMLGNVWEWVEDGYRTDAYARHGLYNPVAKAAPDSGRRVIRGASHRSLGVEVRCANRGFYAANDALGQIGLRLVRQP